jgi:hypothetical protein
MNFDLIVVSLKISDPVLGSNASVYGFVPGANTPGFPFQASR